VGGKKKPMSTQEINTMKTTQANNNPVSVKIERIEARDMKAMGYKLGGSTDDRTMLREIARDLLTTGLYSEVRFTEATAGRVLYWVMFKSGGAL
jgi:hypothetical protein